MSAPFYDVRQGGLVLSPVLFSAYLGQVCFINWFFLVLLVIGDISLLVLCVMDPPMV